MLRPPSSRVEPREPGSRAWLINLRSTSASAFSLVEVTVALGIISFAFVSLLAMVPIGLDTSMNAVDATVETQIVQRVSTVARQARFTELSALDRNTGVANGEEQADFFFDQQANEITDSAAIASGKAIYTAAVTIRATDVPSNQSTFSNSNVATLSILIKRTSAPKDGKLVSLLVANNGL